MKFANFVGFQTDCDIWGYLNKHVSDEAQISMAKNTSKMICLAREFLPFLLFLEREESVRLFLYKEEQKAEDN